MTTPAFPPSTHQRRYWLPLSYPGSGFTAEIAATGTILCAANAAAADGDTVTIGDGINPPKVYEYDKSSNGVAGGHVSWAVGTTAASNATALAALIATNQPALSVADDLAGTLTLTHKWPGAGGNVTILHSGAVTTTVTGLAGGAAAVATSITTDTTIKLHKVKGRSIHITRVSLVVPAGLMQDPANYCNFKLLKGASTVIANWSTLTGANGTLTADTSTDLVMTTTVADTYLADGDQLSLFLDVTGSPTVPPGRLVIEGYEV